MKNDIFGQIYTFLWENIPNTEGGTVLISRVSCCRRRRSIWLRFKTSFVLGQQKPTGLLREECKCCQVAYLARKVAIILKCNKYDVISFPRTLVSDIPPPSFPWWIIRKMHFGTTCTMFLLQMILQITLPMTFIKFHNKYLKFSDDT